MNYIGHLLIITGCNLTSAFIDVPLRITSSVAVLKICAITAGIKNNKLLIKIFGQITYISSFLINNVLKDYDEITEEIRNHYKTQICMM